MDELRKEVGVTPPYGLVGVLDTPAAIYHACEKLRDEGYKSFEAHTPFPVHGLEHAMGLRPSRLPYFVLLCALTGLAAGFGLEWWAHSIAYPLNYSGKPFFAFQAYVPVAFATTILFAAFGTFFGMWAINGLPRLFHPVMQHSTFGRFSDDGFFMSVEADDPRFDADKTRALLEKLGGRDIEEVQP